MLYDQSGRKISDVNPSLEEIKAGFDAYVKKTSTISSQRYGDFSDLPLYFLHPGSHGRLSYNELRSLYETSSSIRPSVDSLVREIAGIPWQILYEDRKYHDSPICSMVTKFFKKMNFDNQDISAIFSSFLNDILVIDKGIIEKVRNPFGQLLELRAVDSAHFTPIIDSNMKSITSYREYVPNYSNPQKTCNHIHSKNDIIYKTFSTITYSYNPLPIIETIVNEVSLLMLTVKNIGAVFSNDDIPPGILHLGNIGLDALERAKASFQQTKDITEKGFSIKVVDNVDKVDWVAFNRPFREMQLAELIPIIERIVARNFGLAPVEAGLGGGGKTSATIGKQDSRSRMLFPLIKMLESVVNNEILYELHPNLQFSYFPGNIDADTEYEKNLLAQVRLGIISLNEFRLETGRPAVKGGDRRYVLLGNEFAEIDANTGEVKYRMPVPQAGRPTNEPPSPGNNTPAVPNGNDVTP